VTYYLSEESHYSLVTSSSRSHSISTNYNNTNRCSNH